MHVLSMSVLLGLSSTSFAELIVNSSPGGSNSASLNWSSEDVSQFMNADEPSPQGSTSVTTTIRQQNSPAATLKPKTVQIINSTSYVNQPSVNARAALVMDAQTGEVLFSKNTNTALPIASITKLMTAVVTSDARLNMSEEITLQPIDFIGPKKASSTLRAGDKMNRAEVLLFALMKSENPAAAALARTYPGGKPAFVAAMNAKHASLACIVPSFMNLRVWMHVMSHLPVTWVFW